MAVETFEWCPRIDAQGTITPRTRTSQFGDGYAQVVGDGINSIARSWQLNFTAKEAVASQISSFWERHYGFKSFLWTPPLGVLGLYRVAEYNVSPNGANIYTLTATFTQAFHP